MKKYLAVFVVLVAFASILNSQTPSQINYQPLFYEPFFDNSNHWIGIGISDQLGSAAIVENNYCEVIAPSESSMIIANELPIDTKRDFEISFGVKINHTQNKAINSTISFSWGCSFDNMYQHSISVTPSNYFTFKTFTDTEKEIIPAKQIQYFNAKELKTITIQKKGQHYSFFINNNKLATVPFSDFFGDGYIFTIGSGLTVLVDYISIDYIDLPEPTTPMPLLMLDAPFANTDKVETPVSDFLISGYAIAGGSTNTIAINGSKLSQDNGRFHARVPLLTGTNVFKVTLTTAKGDSQTKHIEIVRTEPIEKHIVGQKRLALVIGNATYQYAAELKNPLNDADDIAAVLKNIDFEVMHRKNLDTNSFNDVLKEFGQRIQEYDVALVFFAGHGIQVDGKNYIIPINAQLKNKVDLPFEAIDVDKIVNILADTDDNKLNVLILDACRNNPFGNWNRGGAEGLSGIHPPSGVLVAFSTSPGSYASDGIGKNGLYTEELLQQLKISQRIEDVFINTRIAVEQRSNGTQSPWELARLRGKYYLK
jgi:hypothetical protein